MSVPVEEYKIPIINRNQEILAYAEVDKEDFERVNKHSWSLQPVTGLSATNINGATVYMHKFVLNLQNSNKQVGHIDATAKLNNKKSNLFEVTTSQSTQRAEMKFVNKTSKYRGVTYREGNKKPWEVYYARKRYGNFRTEDEAAWAYDQVVLKECGPLAKINGVPKPDNFEAWVSTRNTAPLDKTGEILPSGINWDNKQQRYKISLRKQGPPGTDPKSYQCARKFTSLEEATHVLDSLNTKRDNDWIVYNNCLEITRNSEGVAVIYLTKGEEKFETLVDDDVWHAARLIGWQLDDKGYVSAKESKGIKNGNFNSLEEKGNEYRTLHQYVMKHRGVKGEIVDHISGDKLDNRKCNLRITTQSVNIHNKRKAESGSSIYHGVCWSNQDQRWRVCIAKEGKLYQGGQYEDEKIAAWAADCLSLKLYGDGALLNNVAQPEGYVFHPILQRAIPGSIDPVSGLHVLVPKSNGLFQNVTVSHNKYLVKLGNVAAIFDDVNVANWARDQIDFHLNGLRASTTLVPKPAGWEFVNGRARKI